MFGSERVGGGSDRDRDELARGIGQEGDGAGASEFIRSMRSSYHPYG